MDAKTLLLSAFIGASFVGWPYLSKPLGLKPGLSLFVVLVVALIVLVALASKDIVRIGDARSFPFRTLCVLLGVAAANGLATYLCAVKAADAGSQTGIFLTGVIVFQMTFALVFDWLINHNRPGHLQCLGLALIVPVMWLLAQSPKKP
jgi:drug/metabolite transporter (DMT)-like permease